MSEKAPPGRLDGWYRSAFAQAALSGGLLWAALPPGDLGPLAWVAPVWWVMLIRRRELAQPRPPDRSGAKPRSRLARAPIAVVRWLLDPRHPYRGIWLAGMLFWLAALHWVRLPHWANHILWVALSFYLAFYLPVFVALARVAVHRLRVPVVLAAPVVWTGLELARGYFLTGFTMASLGHTQYRWLELIQLSDLAGAYGVSFVVMLVAACLARMFPCDGRRPALWPVCPAAAVVALAVCYGHFRMFVDNTRTAAKVPSAKVLLIQESIDATMKAAEGRGQEIFRRYFQLSKRALQEHPDADLLVWPETMFRIPEEFRIKGEEGACYATLLTYDDEVQMPEQFEGSEEDFRRDLQWLAMRGRRAMGWTAWSLDVPLILGVDRKHHSGRARQSFNSAVLVGPSGELVGDTYDKMHLVVFGEFVPFARYVPWVHRLTPMNMDLSPGKQPVAFSVGRLRYAPNICYETVIPHLIRRQINTLAARGAEPDVLVNLTNDGWFWGSSELDMHLICGVFRAVECRKPLLIAANTGISAWIDGNGRIRHRGPSQGAAVVLAMVRPDRRESWYLRHGDWPAGVCLATCAVLAVVGVWCRVRRQSGTSGG